MILSEQNFELPDCYTVVHTLNVQDFLATLFPNVGESGHLSFQNAAAGAVVFRFFVVFFSYLTSCDHIF